MTRFFTGLLAGLVIPVLFSFILRWRRSVMADEANNREHGQGYDQEGNAGIRVSDNFFKVDLHAFIVLKLARYISAAWLYMSLHRILFSIDKHAIQSQHFPQRHFIHICSLSGALVCSNFVLHYRITNRVETNLQYTG